VPVRVNHEQLQRTVGPRAAGDEVRAAGSQMLLPAIEIIDQQGVVVAAVVRNDFLLPFADDVQLLIDAQPKPRAGKRERRPRNGFQMQYVFIKCHAPLDIGDMNGDVIELGDKHGNQGLGVGSRENEVWWIVGGWATAGIGLTLVIRVVRINPFRENL
jgi:hypothetical protein